MVRRQYRRTAVPRRNALSLKKRAERLAQWIDLRGRPRACLGVSALCEIPRARIVVARLVRRKLACRGRRDEQPERHLFAAVDQAKSRSQIG